MNYRHDNAGTLFKITTKNGTLEVYVTFRLGVETTSLVDNDNLLDLFDENFAYPLDNTSVFIIHTPGQIH